MWAWGEDELEGAVRRKRRRRSSLDVFVAAGQM